MPEPCNFESTATSFTIFLVLLTHRTLFTNPNANPSSMKILVSSVVEPRGAGSESLDSGSRWIRSFF